MEPPFAAYIPAASGDADGHISCDDHASRPCRPKSHFGAADAWDGDGGTRQRHLATRIGADAGVCAAVAKGDLHIGRSDRAAGAGRRETGVPASLAVGRVYRAVAELDVAAILRPDRGNAAAIENDRSWPSDVIRLPAPVANNTAVLNPPLGMVIDEFGVNSIRPPFNASASDPP
jgi:hypothetical protein